jgi:single-strand DNA-binding protein
MLRRPPCPGSKGRTARPARQQEGCSMPEASVSFAGNLTDQPELRHTEGGIARATLRVAVSGRSRDSEPSFFSVVVWRDQAEHAAASLTRGSRVVVVGWLQQRRRRQRRRPGRQRGRFDLFRGPHATTQGFGVAAGHAIRRPDGPQPTVPEACGAAGRTRCPPDPGGRATTPHRSGPRPPGGHPVTAGVPVPRPGHGPPG